MYVSRVLSPISTCSLENRLRGTARGGVGRVHPGNQRLATRSVYHQRAQLSKT